MKKSLAIFLITLISINFSYAAENAVYLKSSSGVLVGRVTYEETFLNTIKINSFCVYKTIAEGVTCENVPGNSPLLQAGQNIIRNVGPAYQGDNSGIWGAIGRVSGRLDGFIKSVTGQTSTPIIPNTVIENTVPVVNIPTPPPVVDNRININETPSINNQLFDSADRTPVNSIVYQVIERAVPGPQGPAGPQGLQGLPGVGGNISYSSPQPVFFPGTAQFNGNVTSQDLSGYAKTNTDANFTGLTTNTVTGAGLSSCNSVTQKLLYNSTTKLFECGIDGGGASSTTSSDLLYLSASTTNASTSNILTGNITNLTSTNGTITNATITNLSIATLNPTSLTATNATFTNSTSTNNFATTASSTNLFSSIATLANATIGSLNSALATITTLWGNTSNFATSNASTTNATTSNFVTTNTNHLIGTNATLTNATITNLKIPGTLGDVLYVGSTGNITNLGIGSTGQVLKVSGGLPTWGADATSGGSAGLFATTSDSLVIYPTDISDVFVLGAGATSTTGFIAEIVGNTYLRGGLRLSGQLTDSYGTTPTYGQVLINTGTSTQWVATSTLGITASGGSVSTSTANTWTAAQSLITVNASTTNATTTNTNGLTTTNNLSVTGSSTLASTTASNLTVTGSLATNILSAFTAAFSSIFSPLGYFTTLYATTTNATTTNAVTGNITTLNSAIGNLATTNSQTLNASTTNSTTSNISTANITTANIAGGNATLTSATITNLSVTNFRHNTQIPWLTLPNIPCSI